ncbi:penicillin-binding protein 2 [Candidatus Saccharibacteria bacterium]|nr:penicillin-binding protein 2 [Candidatus Saccharibacteria bacterium]
MNITTINNQRIKQLGLLFAAALVIIILRLFYLQIIQHGVYTDIARAEQQKQLTLPASRGELYALDNGEPVKIAMNETVYTVFADPETVDRDELGEIISSLNEIAGAETVDEVRDKLTKENSRYQVVARDITRTQAQLLKDKKYAGIGFIEGSRRTYPEGRLAAQTLGFVNAEGKGQYGIEQYFNERLNGVDGELRTVTDVRNVPLTIGSDNLRREPVDGENLVLTIDRNVQSYAEEALQKGLERAGASDGSVVVMNPNNGDILAMANYPTYNPNEYFKVQDAAQFTNSVVSVPYEPASVIKSFIFAAAIDQGKITPSSTFYNSDSVKIDDATIRNAYTGITGTRTMQEAYDWSLNTGSVYAAQQLGGGQLNRPARDIMYQYYHDRFKMGQLTGIEVAGEAAGSIISPEEEQGNAVRYSNMTFGQGMDVTMLQVASGYSSIINGGTYQRPHIVKGVIDADGDYSGRAAEGVGERVVSNDTSRAMREMSAVGRGNLMGGTNGDKTGYTIGGKTGTSQVVENNRYIFSETIGTYLGFGGATKPEYVIMVRVAAPGKKMEGGAHASPIFTEISNWMIDYLRLHPKQGDQ